MSCLEALAQAATPHWGFVPALRYAQLQVAHSNAKGILWYYKLLPAVLSVAGWEVKGGNKPK